MKTNETQVRQTRSSRFAGQTGFTLIELLVVIAIIAMLAAIILPSLGRAREMARASSCMSNLHNVGMSLQMYTSDNHGYFPASYSYVDGESSAGGYLHWTAAINPNDYTALVTAGTAGHYPRTAGQFVCPSQMFGGWAPSNFTTSRIPSPPSGQVSQSTGIDDKQAPRISYVANEILMPRKKYSSAHDAASPPGTSNLCLVNNDEVEGNENTILLGEFSSSSNCIYGSSVGGGAAYKSHRPTNGLKIVGGGVFDGEGYVLGTKVAKLTAAEATTAIDAVLADRSVAAANHHISYINPDSHRGGSNYVFADGHAAKFTLAETLDAGNYMWGRKVYSCSDKPVIQDNP
jgi:prepilin-type N-terminal cleavage/methylation domain-containing protein/prepilin-type processing-associated H-X9-DG protein